MILIILNLFLCSLAFAANQIKFIESQNEATEQSAPSTIINNSPKIFYKLKTDDDQMIDVSINISSPITTALVVIDVQNCFFDLVDGVIYFDASKKQLYDKEAQEIGIAWQQRFLENITMAISEARSQNSWIVFVEMKHLKKTKKKLRALVSGYDKVLTVIKEKASGAYEIAKELEGNHIAIETMLICGINTDGCVYSTVENLPRFCKSIRKFIVLGDCCCTIKGKIIHTYHLRSMNMWPKIEVIDKNCKIFCHLGELYFELKAFLNPKEISLCKLDHENPFNDKVISKLKNVENAFLFILQLLASFPSAKSVDDRILELMDNEESNNSSELVRNLSLIKPQNTIVINKLSYLSRNKNVIK